MRAPQIRPHFVERAEVMRFIQETRERVKGGGLEVLTWKYWDDTVNYHGDPRDPWWELVGPDTKTLGTFFHISDYSSFVWKDDDPEATIMLGSGGSDL